MWFKSGKNLKEHMEDKIVLFVTTQFTMQSFNDDHFHNHQERGLFVDQWLNEPPEYFIKLPVDEDKKIVNEYMKEAQKVKHFN